MAALIDALLRSPALSYYRSAADVHANPARAASAASAAMAAELASLSSQEGICTLARLDLLLRSPPCAAVRDAAPLRPFLRTASLVLDAARNRTCSDTAAPLPEAGQLAWCAAAASAELAEGGAPEDGTGCGTPFGALGRLLVCADGHRGGEASPPARWAAAHTRVAEAMCWAPSAGSAVPRFEAAVRAARQRHQGGAASLTEPTALLQLWEEGQVQGQRVRPARGAAPANATTNATSANAPAALSDHELLLQLAAEMRQMHEEMQLGGKRPAAPAPAALVPASPMGNDFVNDSRAAQPRSGGGASGGRSGSGRSSGGRSGGRSGTLLVEGGAAAGGAAAGGAAGGAAAAVSADEQPACAGGRRHCPNGPEGAACAEACPAPAELPARNPTCTPALIANPAVFFTALMSYSLKWKLLCDVYTSVHLFYDDYRWPVGYGIRKFGQEFAREHVLDGKGVPYGLAEGRRGWGRGMPFLSRGGDAEAQQEQDEKSSAEEEESGLERRPPELERRTPGRAGRMHQGQQALMNKVVTRQRKAEGEMTKAEKEEQKEEEDEVLAQLMKLDTDGDGTISRDEAKRNGALLALFDEADANGDGSLSIGELAKAIHQQVEWAKLFELMDPYATSEIAGHPPWMEKVGMYWLDLYHPFTWAELWRGAPYFQCEFAKRTAEYLLDHLWLSSFAHAIECYFFAANGACASAVAQARYVAAESLTTIGYGTISPDSWGGDAGYCRKPAARERYRQLRDARVAVFTRLFEWLLWKSEWTQNV